MAQAHRITSPTGKTNLFIMDHQHGQVPTGFALTATRAKTRVCIRIGGGCKGMTDEERVAMIEFFRTAFEGFAGMIWSGGTRSAKPDGSIDPMVTDIPGIVAETNPDCVALGSFPRTGQLHLVDESRLVLDKYGTSPSPSIEGVLIVQDSDKELGWDADLDIAWRLMKQYEESAGWKIAHIAWNGGAVTRDEVMRTLKQGWPALVIKGSGRAADDIVNEHKSGSLAAKENLKDGYPLYVIDKTDAIGLRQLLIILGFIQE